MKPTNPLASASNSVSSETKSVTSVPDNLKIIKKDITTVQRGVVGHGVNCQRVMGSGVAKAIKAKWPIVYQEYIEHKPKLGSIFFTKIPNNQYNHSELYICNMYTQEFYGIEANRVYANRTAIRMCLEELVYLANLYDLPVYTSKVGCGLGGLSWEKDVLPIYIDIAEIYSNVEINVCIL